MTQGLNFKRVLRCCCGKFKYPALWVSSPSPCPHRYAVDNPRSTMSSTKTELAFQGFQKFRPPIDPPK